MLPAEELDPASVCRDSLHQLIIFKKCLRHRIIEPISSDTCAWLRRCGRWRRRVCVCVCVFGMILGVRTDWERTSHHTVTAEGRRGEATHTHLSLPGPDTCPAPPDLTHTHTHANVYTHHAHVKAYVHTRTVYSRETSANLRPRFIKLSREFTGV